MIHQGGRSGVRGKLAFLRGARWIDLKEPTTLAGGGSGGGTPVGTIVELTSDQTIPGGGTLTVTWDQVMSGQNTGGFWSGGNPDYLVASGDGWYILFANVGFTPASNGQNQAQAYVLVNDADIKMSTIHDIYTDDTATPAYGYINSPWFNLGGFRYLSDGDEVSLFTTTSDAAEVRASSTVLGLLKAA